MDYIWKDRWLERLREVQAQYTRFCDSEGMSKNTGGDISQEFGWPKFRWRTAIWAITIPILLSLIPLFPNLLEGMSIGTRLSLAVLIFLGLFVAISTIPWIFKSVAVMIKRTQYYSKLFQQVKSQKHDLLEAGNIIADFVQTGIKISKFPIRKAAFNKNRLYIILLREAESKLSTGDKLRVIDSRDGMPMGEFEVTEMTPGGCYAVGIDVDPVWLGQVRGLGETEVTPGLIAIRLSREGA